MKTIQVTPQIGKNDLARKMKQAQGFLINREQVRIQLVLRGRQKGHVESSLEFLKQIHDEFFVDYGTLAKTPTGDNLGLSYNPASKKNHPPHSTSE